MEKRSYDYVEFFTIEELKAKKTSFYQISELNQWMNIHQRPNYMCFVMDVVEGKNKASHSDFFLTESLRFSFPGEWQVCFHFL